MTTIPDGITRPDGSLYDLGWYLYWDPKRAYAILDGRFTADELRAIADHMDKHSVTKKEKP